MVFSFFLDTLNVLPGFSSGAIPQPRCLHTQVNVGANLFGKIMVILCQFFLFWISI